MSLVFWYVCDRCGLAPSSFLLSAFVCDTYSREALVSHGLLRLVHGGIWQVKKCSNHWLCMERHLLYDVGHPGSHRVWDIFQWGRGTVLCAANPVRTISAPCGLPSCQMSSHAPLPSLPKRRAGLPAYGGPCQKIRSQFFLLHCQLPPSPEPWGTAAVSCPHC